MKRKTKKAIRHTVITAMLLCGVFIVISLLSYEQPEIKGNISYPSVSSEVQEYRPLIEEYAKEYGVMNYVDVLLAMMMQESGGRGNDPMQSSESYCGKRNCIDDPELSIKQGVYYFSRTLEAAKGDLELAIQSYNFGTGFIRYVHDQSGKYSQDIAIDFSKEMYENAPNKSIYRCLREEAKEYNACYGDIYYVRSVMAYRDAILNN